MLYWPWAEYRVLRDAAGVLFICEEERRLARESFRGYSAREAVVGAGIEAPGGDTCLQESAFFARFPQLRDKRVLLYLGRIHPKKGCDSADPIVRRSMSSRRHIAPGRSGSRPQGWRQNLESIAADLGVAEKVTWPGMLSGDEKWGAFRAADAFVLPSHSENFGIVVAESLACGTPVLMTDRVNIWREVVDQGAGLVERDTQSGVNRLLHSWLSMSDDQARHMRARARVCFVREFEGQGVAERLVIVVRSAVSPSAERET